ncbi:uncharacterized protein BO72DRAFT_452968, partial [Aspergillus fijiensis CBS 313.89]
MLSWSAVQAVAGLASLFDGMVWLAGLGFGFQGQDIDDTATDTDGDDEGEDVIWILGL